MLRTTFAATKRSSLGASMNRATAWSGSNEPVRAASVAAAR